jgi:hypothetical protein
LALPRTAHAEERVGEKDEAAKEGEGEEDVEFFAESLY